MIQDLVLFVSQASQKNRRKPQRTAAQRWVSPFFQNLILLTKSFFTMKTTAIHFLLASTATQSTSIDKVLELFELFGKGDLPAILAMCSDDVDWLHGGNPGAIPFAKPFHGKEGVAGFFTAIGQSIQVTNLVPSNFRVEGNEVHHDFHVEATVISTGKSYAADVEYIWTFDQAGKICRHRSPGDYTQAELAFLG